MAKHQDDIIGFDVPRDWDNRTVVAYAAPPRKDGTSAGNIVVTRQRYDGSLQQLVDQRLRTLASRTRGFMLRGQGAIQLAGRTGVSASFASDGNEKRLLAVPVQPGLAVLITFSANGPDAQAMVPLFERILSSVELTT